jgi:hypothetical protein
LVAGNVAVDRTSAKDNVTTAIATPETNPIPTEKGPENVPEANTVSAGNGPEKRQPHRHLPKDDASLLRSNTSVPTDDGREKRQPHRHLPKDDASLLRSNTSVPKDDGREKRQPRVHVPLKEESRQVAHESVAKEPPPQKESTKRQPVAHGKGAESDSDDGRVVTGKHPHDISGQDSDEVKDEREGGQDHNPVLEHGSDDDAKDTAQLRRGDVRSKVCCRCLLLAGH